MDYRDQIASLIVDTLTQCSLGVTRSREEITALLETPKDSKLGDLAFPCFTLAKELRQAPPQISKKLSELVAERIGAYPSLASVHATGPYLNFFLNKASLAGDLIPSILEGDFLLKRPSTGERVMIEYSQPNTHKAFHVGHIRCAALGDSIARLYEFNGDEVIPVNYLGDEGTHVSRCLWYFMTHYKGEVPQENRGEFLGVLYTEAFLKLDLKSYTKVPLPGIRAAKVLSKETHPHEPKWSVVKVDLGGEVKQVVCAGTGFSVGDMVAYAPPGYRMSGRTVGILDKKGVMSEGMICSEKEIELSDNNSQIAILPPTTPGTEVVEVYRIPGTLPDEQGVLETVRGWEREVSEVLQKLEAGDPEMSKLWLETKQWSLDEYYDIYRWLNCRFDEYFFESQFGHAGKDVVREYQEKGVFIESEGAVGADLSPWNLGFCILIKRDGTALYATRDLALAKKKFEEYKVTRSIYVVDSAQTLHFQQVFQCLGLMGFEHAKDCFHVAYAQVVRPDGKMSSRKGNVILFSELKKRLLDKINQEFLDKYQGEWSEEELSSAAHLIALATMRYGMLNQDNNSQVIFDLDEWTSRSGNTGPYMLYAVARVKSIVRDAKGIDRALARWDLLTDETEIELLLHLKSYHDVVKRAGQNFSPNIIATYVYELSKKFSRFYHQCSVLNAETEELKAGRLLLAESVGKVLQHGLGLLGITAVERM